LRRPSNRQFVADTPLSLQIKNGLPLSVGFIVRWHMVEIIGLGVMSALVWLLAWSMAGESDSERRRISMSRGSDRFADTIPSQTQTRHAA